VYRHVQRTEIVDALAHLRELHRQITPSTERERYAFERRELVTKNLLSNLRRTGDHPTLSMLLEIADMFSLTIEGAHRLFGYDLGGIREYDLRLNGRRTHIVESYVFERDILVDLPLELASSEAFASDATLRELVRRWQRDVPHTRVKGVSLAPARGLLCACRHGGQPGVEPTTRGDGSCRADGGGRGTAAQSPIHLSASIREWISM
jgi:hypothetical protein